MLTELIPLALVVAFSPLSIIPAVLVLYSPRPRTTGLAFLAGWLFGLAAATAVFVEVSHLLGGLDRPRPWAPWVRIVVGSVLIVLGVVRWLTRGRAEGTPAWMRSITKVGPARSAATGVVLTVINPKVLLMCAAAGLEIGTAGLGTAGAWSAVVYFALLAGWSVAVPIVGYAVSGDRLKGPLARLNEWMEAHNATFVAVILLVIGALILYKGIQLL